MKSILEAAGTLLICPEVLAASKGPPPVYVTLVPVFVAIQPTLPPSADNQVMVFEVSVAPPLLQLRILTNPEGAVKAVEVIANVHTTRVKANLVIFSFSSLRLHRCWHLE